MAYRSARGAPLVNAQSFDQTHSAKCMPAAEAHRLTHECQAHAAFEGGERQHRHGEPTLTFTTPPAHDLTFEYGTGKARNNTTRRGTHAQNV